MNLEEKINQAAQESFEAWKDERAAELRLLPSVRSVETAPHTDEEAPHGDDTEPTAKRRLILTPASAFKLRRVTWLWHLRIALGTLALLAGPEGLGKSTIGYWLAARITRGDLPGHYFGTPRSVLVCATEDSWEHTIVPRLMAHGADLDRVYRIEVRLADDIAVGLSLPADLAATEEAARDVDAALLILDPLMSRLDSTLDTHRDGDVRRALEPLVSVADNTTMAILGLIHHNKSGSSDPLQLVMASKAFTAVARSVHTAIKDPDDDSGVRRLFGTPKNNLGRTDLPTMSYTIAEWEFDTDEGPGSTGQLIWGDTVEGSIADALLRADATAEQKTAVKDATEWLDEYMKTHGPRVSATDAKKAGERAGHRERTLQRARSRLRLITEPSHTVPPEWFWAAPVLPTALGETHLWQDWQYCEQKPQVTPTLPVLPTLPDGGTPGTTGNTASTVEAPEGLF